MHDPVGICAVLFREFGLCPFGDEVSQYMGFDGSPWLIGYIEREKLDVPFCNPARCVAVVDNIIEWYFRGYCYGTLLKVVS